MAHQTHRLGGFSALNTGRIVDCYCQVKLRGNGSTLVGGFCGENRGELLRCFSRGQVLGKGKRGGFVARQDGTVEHCFWQRRDGLDASDWPDRDLSLTAGEIRRQRLQDWDLQGTWYFDSETGADGMGLYDVRPEEEEHDRVVEIGDAKALLAFAREVNSGEVHPGTLYRLTADIDLGGRSWVPVGLDQEAAFQGRFDGGGHWIRNFTVSARKYPFAGLFGCVGEPGTVCSVHVDCVLLGKGNCAAPLCAMNQGKIVNCTAVSHADLSRYAGGLVAQNSGLVARCAAFGVLKAAIPIPWQASALLLLLLCFPLPIYFAVTAQAEAQEVFAPVILDPNAVPIQPDDEEIITPPPAEETTDTSASFIMNAEMWVSTENYAGSAGLRCPTWSTRGFVATVRLTAEDMARIGYQGGEEYVTLYQSGLIAPGYGVDVITLGALPDGSWLPAGEYELSVLLEFYDVETNEKSAVNTVIPLDVTVS